MIPSARGPMEDVISDRINTSRDARKVPSMVERRNVFPPVSGVLCCFLPLYARISMTMQKSSKELRKHKQRRSDNDLRSGKLHRYEAFYQS